MLITQNQRKSFVSETKITKENQGTQVVWNQETELNEEKETHEVFREGTTTKVYSLGMLSVDSSIKLLLDKQDPAYAILKNAYDKNTPVYFAVLDDGVTGKQGLFYLTSWSRSYGSEGNLEISIGLALAATDATCYEDVDFSE